MDLGRSKKKAQLAWDAAKGPNEARKATLTDQKRRGWTAIFGHTPSISVVFHGDLKKILVNCCEDRVN